MCLDGCLTSHQQAKHFSGTHQLRLCSVPQYKLQIKLATSPNHSILTPGKPDIAPIPECQISGKVATGILILKSQVLLTLGLNHRSPVVEADSLLVGHGCDLADEQSMVCILCAVLCCVCVAVV